MWFDNIRGYKQSIDGKKSSCTCSDFVYRKLKKEDPKNPLSKVIQIGECKHIKEMRRLGQDDIYRLLKKKKKWMSIKEMAKELGTGASSISLCLGKLVKQKEVFKKEARDNGVRYHRYKIK